MRQDLVLQVRETLQKSGYSVSEPHNLTRIAFDLVARRDKSIIFIKALSNIDSFSKENAEELVVLAEALKGSPLVVGLHSGSGGLEDGVVYSRFGVPIVTKGTLDDLFVEGVPPFIFAAPGGLYVNIDGDILRQARKKGVTLGELANAAGVSRRTIQMYEDGMGALVDAALRLEEYLKEPLVKAVNPFDYDHKTLEALNSFDGLERLDKEVFKHLDKLGYRIVPTSRCPFDALTNDMEVLFLTGIGRYDRNLAKRAKVVGDMSSVVEKHAVIFTETPRMHKNLEGTPLISSEELDRIDDPKAIVELIIERRVRK